MRYLLDTKTCIYFLNEPSLPTLTERFVEAGPEGLALSSVTVAELHFGAERSARPESNRRRIAQLAAELAILPFDDRCAECFGRLKASLLRRGRPLADFDLAIAATAQIHGLALVTHDRAFAAVPGLALEDWVGPA